MLRLSKASVCKWTLLERPSFPPSSSVRVRRLEDAIDGLSLDDPAFTFHLKGTDIPVSLQLLKSVILKKCGLWYKGRRVYHPAFDGFGDYVYVSDESFTPGVAMFAWPAKMSKKLEELPVRLLEWKASGGAGDRAAGSHPSGLRGRATEGLASPSTASQTLASPRLCCNGLDHLSPWDSWALSKMET